MFELISNISWVLTAVTLVTLVVWSVNIYLRKRTDKAPDSVKLLWLAAVLSGPVPVFGFFANAASIYTTMGVL
jgi:hypothetical protein